MKAQNYLKPGFDKGEYLEMLRIAGHIADSTIMVPHPPPLLQYRFAYRSAEVGLKNQWQVWVRKDEKVGVSPLCPMSNMPKN